MQSDLPGAIINIQITATLKTDIEEAAAAAGQSVNAWVASLLEAAVTHAQEIADDKRAAVEKARKRVDARLDKALEDILGTVPR
jgi:uncharacterized protein (DUF1778 family)